MFAMFSCLSLFFPSFPSFLLLAIRDQHPGQDAAYRSFQRIYITQMRRILNATKIFFHFPWHYFSSWFFMWISRCQVISVVTPLHIFLHSKQIEGQHPFMLVVWQLVHTSFHVSFDISFRFAAFDSSLFSFHLLPFLFIFSPGLYLWSVKLRVILVCTSVFGSHSMLVYRDCQASHWKIEPPSKWLEGGHYTHIIIYHNIIISWRILSIWCFHAEGFWAWS